MENRYLENKIIVKYCKDYYRIINEEFSELDFMSGRLIQIYQAYIFSINARVKEQLKSAVDLNTAVARYFDDREFKTMLTNMVLLNVTQKIKLILPVMLQNHGTGVM